MVWKGRVGHLPDPGSPSATRRSEGTRADQQDRVGRAGWGGFIYSEPPSVGTTGSLPRTPGFPPFLLVQERSLVPPPQETREGLPRVNGFSDLGAPGNPSPVEVPITVPQVPLPCEGHSFLTSNPDSVVSSECDSITKSTSVPVVTGGDGRRRGGEERTVDWHGVGPPLPDKLRTGGRGTWVQGSGEKKVTRVAVKERES